jgi:hypothetical protein
MPLPADQAWPPRALAGVRPRLEEWDAWYRGDVDRLAAVYQARPGAKRAPVRPGQLAGGVVGAWSRFWYGRPQTDLTQPRRMLHVPVAADLARASGDLLYAEAPRVAVPARPQADGVAAEPTQTAKRLAEYVDDGMHDVLATGAEVGAALGGRFHRVTWDHDLDLKRPFLSTVDADQAWPEFRWGRLVAVTFWSVVARNGQQVLRHLERHELDGGVGITLHGLYEGTDDALGRMIPLNDTGAPDSVARLAGIVDQDGAVVEGRTPGLAVAYVPNQTPARGWRLDPVGRNLGRSDFEQAEPLFDGIDETYTSLMRDVRLAKGRLIVPSFMLGGGVLGQGSTFDVDREVYEELNTPPDEQGRGQITPQQFAIRVDEHLRIVDDLVQRAIGTAGYSTQTLADGLESGAQMTATEVHARERRSYTTRDRKIRHERPALVHLVRKMLTVDAAVFNTPGLDPDGLTVTFPDSVQDSPLSLAQTAQALSVARAASTHTLVQLVHPEWEQPEVDAEVERILGEQRAVVDPYTFTG